MALTQEGGFGGAEDVVSGPLPLENSRQYQGAAPPRPFILKPGSEEFNRYDAWWNPEHGVIRGEGAQLAFQQGGEEGYLAYIRDRIARDPALKDYAGEWPGSLAASAQGGDAQGLLLPPPSQRDDDHEPPATPPDPDDDADAPEPPPLPPAINSTIPEMGDELNRSMDGWASVLAARRSSAAGAVARSDLPFDKYLAWFTRRKGNNLHRQNDTARAAFETALDAEIASVADSQKDVVRQARIRQLEERVGTSWLQQIGATAVSGATNESRWGRVRNRLSGAYWQQEGNDRVLRQHVGNVIVPAVVLGCAIGAVALQLPWEFQVAGLGAAPAAGGTLGGWQAEQASKYRDGVMPARPGVPFTVDDIEAATWTHEEENREMYWEAKKNGALAALIAFLGTEAVWRLTQFAASVGTPPTHGRIGAPPTPTPHTMQPTPPPTTPPTTPPTPSGQPPINYHEYPWTAAQDLLAQHSTTATTPLELVQKAADAYNAANGTDLQLVGHGTLPNGSANVWLQWPHSYMSWADVQKFNEFMANHLQALTN